MTEILHFDEQLFHLINSGWHNPFFDVVMPFLRNKYVWMPFYLFLLTFLLINFKKNGLFLVLALALTIGMADFTSSHLIKKKRQKAAALQGHRTPLRPSSAGALWQRI